MKTINTCIFLFLFLCSCISISAQDVSIGVSTGSILYQGDLSERISLHTKDFHFVYGGFIKYHFTDKLSLRVHYLQGKISGSDSNYPNKAWRMARGFKFQSPLQEVASVVEWDIIERSIGRRSKSKGSAISLYVSGALGYVKTNPEVDFNEPKMLSDDVNIDKLAQYNRTHISAALGVGIKWHINKHQILSIESSNRTAFTDYLDGISKTAQPKYHDWYFITMLSFSQKLSVGSPKISSSTVICPRF